MSAVAYDVTRLEGWIDRQQPTMGRSIDDALAVLERSNPYHDKDGKFSSGHGSGAGGGDAADSESGIVGGGDYGLGTAPDGSSYTEFDVDENGHPRFSESYRKKYGAIQNEQQIGDTTFSLVEPSKGSVHIANDAHGTHDREVVLEVTPKGAHELGNGVYSVYSGKTESFTSSQQVHVVPASNHPTQDGVHITFPGGQRLSLQGESGDDSAFDFQEALSLVS